VTNVDLCDLTCWEQCKQIKQKSLVYALKWFVFITFIQSSYIHVKIDGLIQLTVILPTKLMTLPANSDVWFMVSTFKICIRLSKLQLYLIKQNYTIKIKSTDDLRATQSWKSLKWAEIWEGLMKQMVKLRQFSWSIDQSLWLLLLLVKWIVTW